MKMNISKSIRCPAGSEDCPYYSCGWCQLEEETGSDPLDECDDYAYYVDEEEDAHEDE